MPALPTLRRELVTALALVFAGALLVFVLGLLYVIPRIQSMAVRDLVLYFMLLVSLDVGLFVFFGHWLLQRRVLRPIEEMVVQMETIAAGEYERRLAEGDTRELSRVAAAVNHMTVRMTADQAELAGNIRSLDETNRMLTEARDAMVRAEKMASVGRLSAGIAHEVGNPLGAILGYLGLIARNTDVRTRDLAQAAEREAHRIDRIVRGLLDYARPRDPKSLAMSVNTVVRDTLELMETQGKLTGIALVVELVPDDELPAVRGDPYQLQQVLVNLLVNAVDALSEQKEPRIEVRTNVTAYEKPRAHPARRQGDPPGIDYSHRRRLARIAGPNLDPIASVTGRVVEISVTDNGPGIEAEVVDQIFEPFVTTKDPGKGTGLGLAVCARLVETMGGNVRARSAPGEGATFYVVLPAAPREKQQGRS
jgi:signal transduction histidine kinase